VTEMEFILPVGVVLSAGLLDLSGFVMRNLHQAWISRQQKSFISTIFK
jgi:hypothetical protein